ncbi:MAG TPA: TonB-dependent receptor [Thermoanaerobaculia bacterium]|jgi:outer membrane receptor protein involved in Fe transport
MRGVLRSACLALAFLSAALCLGQTTGDIVGRVTDEQGGALPGATVEARSPSFQGVRTNVTDATGTFRLILLPPGTYTVIASLPGFSRVEQTVKVELGKTASSEMKLRAAVKEEIVVSGQAPVVDESSSAVGTNIDNRKIQSLPTGRNYTSIVQIAPGVSTQSTATSAFADAITVYGSTGLENSFVIDGVLTSGVEYGAQGKELNYEFVQELDVKTGGYEAEFGRSTGGIINVITKSGGNEFHGETFVYYDNGSLQANNKHKNETLYGTLEGYNRLDFGVDGGGYFVKDHLWFFGAYDRVQNTIKQTISQPGIHFGEQAPTDSTRNLASAKLTWMITPSHSLVGSFFQDPRDDVGAVNDGSHPLNGPPETFEGTQAFGGEDYSARYNGLFGPAFVVTAQGAIHKEQNSVLPGPGGDVIQTIDRNNDFAQSGGFGLIQEKHFKRYQASIAGTSYLGNHEIKGGFEYLEDKADVIKRESGGQLVTILNIVGYNGPPVYQHFYWTVPDAALPDNVPTDQLNATPYHRSYSFFLQDSWRLLPNLTVNAGVRYDNQQVFSGDGTRQINLTGSWAPRIGVTWDATNDGKTRVFGSFGYFYEQIPMDLVIRSYSSERQPTIYNFDPTSVVPDINAAILAGDDAASQTPEEGTSSACCGGKIFGGFNDLTDPGIKGQYVREGIFGVEREVIPNFAVGAKFIYRDLPRVVEDYLCTDGINYCVGNPTQDGMSTLSTLDYNFRLPAPLQKRIYKGFQVDATKRFSECWTMLASYVYSTLKGNYDGLFSPYSQPRGTADPNISALYDYYDFFTSGQVINGQPRPFTANGYLSNDRRHQVKLSGVYLTPFNLSLGMTAYYRTGTPISRLGLSEAYGRYEFFLLPRGSEGRVPADYEADIHLGYPLQIGPVTLTTLIDVFNVLNRQRTVAVDQRYNLAEFVDDPAQNCPKGSSDNGCNAFFGTAIARTPPTSVRFGLKLGF